MGWLWSAGGWFSGCRDIKSKRGIRVYSGGHAQVAKLVFQSFCMEGANACRTLSGGFVFPRFLVARVENDVGLAVRRD